MSIILFSNYFHKGIILKNLYDIAIIGAGASGLVAAINLASKGFSVILIEHQNRGGKKILASGNGHCNIGNLNVSAKEYKIRNKELIKELLSNCDSQKIIEFFNTLGLEIIAKADGKLFPKSMQASSVLELLEAKVKSLNIDTIYNAKELKVKKGFSLSFNGKSIKSKKVVVATGSIAAPQLGGSNFGAELAKEFGHNVIKPIPALVPLVSKNPICKALNGVKLEVSAKLIVQNKEITSKKEDILFRDYGISGLVTLDLSLDATNHIANKKSVYISVDFLSEFSKKDATCYLKKRINKSRNLPINLWLSGFLHTKLAQFITKELNLQELSEARVNSKIIKELVEILKNYNIKIDNQREFKYAEVALGGVDSTELNPKTLESKKQKGLYFIGEVLDTAAQRGGYNFHFAWCSALRL